MTTANPLCFAIAVVAKSRTDAERLAQAIDAARDRRDLIRPFRVLLNAAVCAAIPLACVPAGVVLVAHPSVQPTDFLFVKADQS